MLEATDGRIAFAVGDGGRNGIAIVNADGSDFQEIVTPGTYANSRTAARIYRAGRPEIGSSSVATAGEVQTTGTSSASAQRAESLSS